MVCDGMSKGEVCSVEVFTPWNQHSIKLQVAARSSDLDQPFFCIVEVWVLQIGTGTRSNMQVTAKSNQVLQCS